MDFCGSGGKEREPGTVSFAYIWVFLHLHLSFLSLDLSSSQGSHLEILNETLKF